MRKSFEVAITPVDEMYVVEIPGLDILIKLEDRSQASDMLNRMMAYKIKSMSKMERLRVMLGRERTARKDAIYYDINLSDVFTKQIEI